MDVPGGSVSVIKEGRHLVYRLLGGIPIGHHKIFKVYQDNALVKDLAGDGGHIDGIFPAEIRGIKISPDRDVKRCPIVIDDIGLARRALGTGLTGCAVLTSGAGCPGIAGRALRTDGSLQGNSISPAGQGFGAIKGIGQFVDIKVADVAKGGRRDTIALEDLAAGGSGGALRSRRSLQPRRPLRACGTGCPFGTGCQHQGNRYHQGAEDEKKITFFHGGRLRWGRIMMPLQN